MSVRSRVYKKALGLLLSVALAVSMIPSVALAETSNVTGKVSEDSVSTDAVESNFVSEDNALATVASYSDSTTIVELEPELTEGWNQFGTCEWLIDSSGCLTIRPLGDGESGKLNDIGSSGRAPWLDQSSLIESAVVAKGVSSSSDVVGLFENCSNLASVDLSGLDTSSATNMDHMFSRCTSLISVDLSSFDTSNVTSMSCMFEGCSSLSSLDLSAFDTSNVENMNCMINDCPSLTEIDLSSFDTSNVKRMNGIFAGCSSLSSIDISSFDTSSVEDMGSMFSDCSKLASVDLSGLDTSSAEIMSHMFSNCSKLASVDLSGLDTSDVSTMRGMFFNCSKLASVDLSGLDTSDVEDMGFMFYHCWSLPELDLSGLDVSSVTDMELMLEGCSSLSSLRLFSASADVIPMGFLQSLGLVKPIKVYVLTKELFDLLSANPDYISVDCATVLFARSMELTYLANAEDAIGEMAATEGLLDEMVAVANCGFLRAGYEFAGWNTSDDGSGIAYSPGDELLLASDGIKLYAQWAESDFAYTISDKGSATITAYNGDGGDVVIPSVIGGLPVKAIGEKAFYENKSITSVVIPSTVTSIGSRSFLRCSSLKSICIPEGVKTIESYSFWRCTSLESVTLPSTISSIEAYAFYWCESLSSVSIPAGVTSIGEHAFYSCSSLKTVLIPASVTSIANYVFSYCPSLASIDVEYGNENYSSVDGVLFSKDGTALVCYPAGAATAYSIPEGVTSIKSTAFYGCSKLLSVIIPSSVISIGRSAFYGCSKLSSVDLPPNITSIEGSSFSACRSLTSIVIPSGVTSIGDYAFRNCSSLASIEIPASVASISESAFSGESNAIVIRCWAGSYAEEYAIGHGYSIEYVTRFDYIDVEIAQCVYNGVAQIPRIAVSYYETPLVEGVDYEIVCEAQVESGEHSFILTGHGDYEGCSHSYAFVISPADISTVDGLSISDQTYTGSAVEPELALSFNGVALVEDVDYEVEYSDSVAVGATSATVSGIGNFRGEVVIEFEITPAFVETPKAVEGLVYSGFEQAGIVAGEGYELSGAVSATAAGTYEVTATLLDSHAWSDGSVGDKTLTWSIAKAPNAVELSGVANWVEDEEPAAITASADFGEAKVVYATEKDGEYTEVVPTAVGAYYAKAVVVESDNWLAAESNPVAFEITASTGVPSGLTYRIYNGEVAITDYTGSRTDLEIPAEIEGYPVTEIRSFAFQDCAALINVAVPDGVTFVGGFAFDGCTNLESISMPDSVASIGHYAFLDCTALESIILPASLTSIENELFQGCSSLEFVVIPDVVTSIGSGAFRYCSSLASVSIPAGVLSIGEGAFYSCGSLESVTLPEKLASIESDTFANCSSLASVSIPESVASIGDSAFRNCNSLESIVLPSSVISIGGSAFSSLANPSTIVAATQEQYDLLTGSEASSYISRGRTSVTLIASAPVAVTDLVYTGSEQQGVPEGAGYTLEGATATDAGSYVATATLLSGCVWADGSTEPKTIPWSIAKAQYDMSGAYFSDGKARYDGKEHYIKVLGKLPDGITVSYEGNNRIDVGSNEVIASFTGDSNHEEIASMSATLTVEPAVLTATYAGESIAWDGVPGLAVSVEGFVNGETAQTAAGYTAPAITALETLAPGGAYELTPAGGAAANYVFEYVSGTLSVGLRSIEVPRAAADLVYTGLEQTGVAAGEGYVLSGWTSATGVGTYMATATLLDGYVWSDGSTEPVTISWSIGYPDAEMLISLGSVNASPGETISVPVRVVGNEGVAAMRVKFSYDESVLTLKGVEAGELLKGSTVNVGESADGAFYVLWYKVTDVTDDGVLCYLQFEVASDAAVGANAVLSVDYDAGDICTAGHRDLFPGVTKGSVNVVALLLGDVYEDEQLNVHDVLLLQQHLTELVDFTSRQDDLADVNEDGSINMKDLVALAQSLVAI